MKGLYTILLLIVSNVFMTFAWYGHLKLQDMNTSAETVPPGVQTGRFMPSFCFRGASLLRNISAWFRPTVLGL